MSKLRDYQQDIVDKVFQTNESTLIHLPTGSGKTLVAKEIVRILTKDFNKQVLFVAPTKTLMTQTKDKFTEEPLSINSKLIHGKDYDKNHHVLISTIQTASKRDINPDVIIIDEVHYGYDGKMIEKLIKDKSNLRVIGLSATPYDKDGNELKGFELILNKYNMKYMIEHKWLVPLESKTLVRIYNLDKVKITQRGDYNERELSKIVSNERTILEITKTTKEYIEEYKKTIVFAVNITHAELLAKQYEKEGFITGVVHSKRLEKNNKLVITDFKMGKIKILVSVSMLTTGFDVDDTDVIVIARPTKSQNLYKQMIGRVLRTANEKTHAVFLDCGNIIEELGMPLEAIKPKEIKQKFSDKCCKCDSKNIILKKENDKSYWICKNCGDKKEIKQGVYECKICRKSYSQDAKFEEKNNKLFLVCSNPECEFPTLLSEYTGLERFIRVNKQKEIIIEKEKSIEEKIKEDKESRDLKRKLESAKKTGKIFKIAKSMSKQYYEYLTDKNIKNNLELLKEYMQSNLIKEHYHKILPEIIGFDKEKFINYLINFKEDFDNWFLLVKEEFYKEYLNQIYINEIKSFIQNQVENIINGCSEKLILAYKIPENIFNLIKEKQQDFFNLLTNEELENLKKEIKFLQIYLYIDYNWYVLSIYFDNNSSKIEKSKY